MPTFAIAKLLALSGPPNPGVVSEATEVPVTDNWMLLGSEFKSTAIPVPVMPRIVIALPAELDTGILFDPNVLGVSLNEVKLI